LPFIGRRSLKYAAREILKADAAPRPDVRASGENYRGKPRAESRFRRCGDASRHDKGGVDRSRQPLTPCGQPPTVGGTFIFILSIIYFSGEI